MKPINNKKQEKLTCIDCIHWNEVTTPFLNNLNLNDIELNDETIPELLKMMPKGTTIRLSNENGEINISKCYCKKQHTKPKGSNCKDFKKNPHIEIKTF